MPRTSLPTLLATLAAFAAAPAAAFVAINLAAHVFGVIEPVDWAPQPALLLGGGTAALALCAVVLRSHPRAATRILALVVLTMTAAALAVLLLYAALENFS